MIGVICPSQFEYEVLHRAHLDVDGVQLIKSGMGKLRAAWACQELLNRFQVRHILLIGFAGGLTTDLKVGDVIEPRVFIEQDYFAEPFEKFPNRINSASKPLIKNAVPAIMLTQDRFLTENPYKKTDHKETLACDMESYAVAFFCEKAACNYNIIKIISDSADENADHDFLKACKELSPKLNETVKQSLDVLRKMLK